MMLNFSCSFDEAEYAVLMLKRQPQVPSLRASSLTLSRKQISTSHDEMLAGLSSSMSGRRFVPQRKAATYIRQSTTTQSHVLSSNLI